MKIHSFNTTIFFLFLIYHLFVLIKQKQDNTKTIFS